ncbi:unnamed protein product [Schistosoma curassoni]|uniref:Uncharacterized protein n=1 Tax=Schistosoma curassoni TaxID=6186 RepID=A0A183KVJ5_9TREM|nr:unnamed protein product [Schistosoma curassoni]
MFIVALKPSTVRFKLHRVIRLLLSLHSHLLMRWDEVEIHLVLFYLYLPIVI